jgi:hypothetical protein
MKKMLKKTHLIEGQRKTDASQHRTAEKSQEYAQKTMKINKNGAVK